ncbi:hypothetical protein GIB67_032014, partial [Kingdonia uniflora]
WATANSILYLISKSLIVVEVAKVGVAVVEGVEVDDSPFTSSNHLRKPQPPPAYSLRVGILLIVAERSLHEPFPQGQGKYSPTQHQNPHKPFPQVSSITSTHLSKTISINNNKNKRQFKEDRIREYLG